MILSVSSTTKAGGVEAFFSIFFCSFSGKAPETVRFVPHWIPEIVKSSISTFLRDNSNRLNSSFTPSTSNRLYMGASLFATVILSSLRRDEGNESLTLLTSAFAPKMPSREETRTFSTIKFPKIRKKPKIPMQTRRKSPRGRSLTVPCCFFISFESCLSLFSSDLVFKALPVKNTLVFLSFFSGSESSV